MVVKVYWDCVIVLLCEIELVIVMIDDKYLFCVIESGVGGVEQVYWVGVKNSYVIVGFDFGVFNCLSGGGQNI